MEVEENSLPIVDNNDENNPKKGKLLTLLFPTESQPTEGKEAKRDKNKPPSKVVIRRLPPRLTKDAFIEEFSPLPPYDYFHFVRGDLNLGVHAFSRAYINFLNQEDIFAFKEKFDDFDLQDDKGRTYHAVVEFAPFQKIPKRNIVKKKLSKAGTLESDPKYIEFLQKLEESKNFISNPSEYFHETENSALKAKVVTTPLLEFLKRKRQKKIDLKNEIRQRKREAEREKRRKEEERRKAEREKRKEEKKNLERNKTLDDRGKKLEERVKDKRSEDRGKLRGEKKELKIQKNTDNDCNTEEQLTAVIPNDPAILEVVVRRSEKECKSPTKSASLSNEDSKSVKTNESETNLGKPERKYSDFRTRITEEKQRKTYNKKELKGASGNRKGVPDEKGDNCTIGTCSEVREPVRKTNSEMDNKRHDYKVEVKETKSKFRYSEQRNRDREYRQKTSDCKTSSSSQPSVNELKNKCRGTEEKKGVKENCTSEDLTKHAKDEKESEDSQNLSDSQTNPTLARSRRKSLEMVRNIVQMERKRSKSFHDISSKDFCDFDGGKKMDRRDSERGRDDNTPENDSPQTDDNSKESTESDKMDDDPKKDPRLERRIRNKDRPSLEIYRPGMGKFSKQRLEQKKEDSNPASPTGTPYSNKNNRVGFKASSKKPVPDTKSPFKGDETPNKNNGTPGKVQSEVRTMTFTRSASKEN